MAGIATVQVVGNLGGDPETGITPNGKENVKFSIAVSKRNRDGSEVTNWYRVTAWAGLATTLTDLTQRGSLAKGSKVFVSGRLEPREYTDKNGALRTSLDVSANEVQLVGERRDQSGGGGGGQSQDYRDVDDIPF
jgi:single-strand DNA-binding protein